MVAETGAAVWLIIALHGFCSQNYFLIWWCKGIRGFSALHKPIALARILLLVCSNSFYATFLQKESHCMCRFLYGAEVICTAKKGLSSCFSFKVNISTCIYSPTVQVWVQRNYQCQWHYSESEKTAWLIWKEKIQLWWLSWTEMCAHMCMNTSFLTLHYPCF